MNELDPFLGMSVPRAPCGSTAPELGVFISGDLDSISGQENPAEAEGDASHSRQQIPGMHLKHGLDLKARLKSCFC